MQRILESQPMPDHRKACAKVRQSAAPGDRVVMLRPREGLRSGRARRVPVIDPKHDPAWLLEQRHDHAGGLEVEDDDDDRYRALTNIIGAALMTILIATGVWLAHAIVDVTARAG
jgi:hypothetical protein